MIILVVLAAILLTPIKICIKYDSTVRVVIRAFIFRYTVVPKKKRKKGMSRKKFLSRFSKNGEKKKPTREKKVKNKPTASGIIEYLKFVAELICKLSESLFTHLKVKVSKINIVIATDDAAKTAIMCGVASQSVSYILELLDNISSVKKAYRCEISVLPDFLGTESSMQLDIQLQYRIFRIFGLLFTALKQLMKKPRKKATESVHTSEKNSENKMEESEKCQKTN